jgi:FAD/FMN-containing dehydrogenase
MSEFRIPRQPLVEPGEVRCLAADMTAIVSARATLGDVQKSLAGFEQWLPIDGDETETIGRLIERNSTGPLRLGFGGWRDLLLGNSSRPAG